MQLYSYLYENTMFTNKWDAALWRMENAWEVRGGVRRVAQGCQIKLKMSADTIYDVILSHLPFVWVLHVLSL